MGKLEKKILKVMGVNVKSFDKLSEKEKYKFNSIRQKIKGKKKYDYFEITEPGHSKSVFKYKNLKDWDKNNYEFQKKHNTAVREKYDELYMPGDWFRALELDSFGKRHLVYGQLESARSYLLTMVLTKLSEAIDRVYPSILIRPYGQKTFRPAKKKNGKTISYYMNDYEERACGNEKKRDILRKRLYDLTYEIEENIIEEIKLYSGCTFRKYSEGPRYEMLDLFIIGGFEVAEQISFKNFFPKFVEFQQPIEYLDRIGHKIYKKYKRKLFSPKKGERKD